MIVSIGEPMVEFNQVSERNYLQGFGGDSSNMIIAAARSGARTAYVTRVGDDQFGRMLLELWKREGVDTSGVGVDRDAPTGVYFVSHRAKGHVFSYLRSGSAASRMRPQDLPKRILEKARYVHASGISLAISPSAADTVFAAYSAAKGKISFDSNLRLKLWPLARARALIGAAAAMADYFFPSIEDAGPTWTGPTALARRWCSSSSAPKGF
jgi:2-dehydro-3-deoxygluconokinase